MDNNVRWICENDGIESIAISRVETLFDIKFSEDYIKCVMKNDGGYPKPNRFILNGSEEVFNNLLSFNEEDSSNIIDVYSDVKDRLAERIIPFAEDPFGNFICFDYRGGKDVPPAIVFWNHELASEDPEKAITPICESFTELLQKLHEGEIE